MTDDIEKANYSKNSKILKWTRRLLSTASLTVLLVTFVVKEAMREESKDLRDTVSNASNAYLEQKGSLDNYSRIRKLQDELRQSGTLPRVYYRRDVRYEESLLESFQLLQDVERLREALPENSDINLTLGNAKVSYEAYEARQQEMRDYWKTTGRGVSKETIKAVEGMEKQLGIAADTFLASIQRAADVVFREAHAKTLQADRDYKMWTERFYYLFGLGWILAIARIWVGGDDAAEGLEA
jgi:hypothetical protein